MKIAIYGAGSLGIVLGAYLTKAGLDIDLYNHNKNQVDALNKTGAKITGTVEFSIPVKAYTNINKDMIYDMIILMTKQQNNKEVVTMLKDHLSEDGVLVTAQNGLPEPLISSIIGGNRTVGCAVAWGATLKDNGCSELTSNPDSLTFTIGCFNDSAKKHLPIVKDVLSKMGPTEIHPNFIDSRFTKLLINSAFSGLSACLGETFGEVAKDKTSRLFAQRIIKECIDVAERNNIKIEKIQGKDVKKLLDYKSKLKQKISFFIIPIAIKKHRNLKASMLQDLEKGKKCEIEAINGVITQYGKLVNYPTLVNDMVIEVIRKIENGEIKPAKENIKYFLPLK